MSIIFDESVLVAATADGGRKGFWAEAVRFEPFAERVWELRRNVTSYDAWYLAVAEAFVTPFAALDRRFGRASGPACRFRLPG